jgi:hypothetical protein
MEADRHPYPIQTRGTSLSRDFVSTGITIYIK